MTHKHPQIITIHQKVVLCINIIQVAILDVYSDLRFLTHVLNHEKRCQISVDAANIFSSQDIIDSVNTCHDEDVKDMTDGMPFTS